MAARPRDTSEAAEGGWHAREIARRNQADGRPLSPVMKTAATACELAHRSADRAAERRRE